MGEVTGRPADRAASDSESKLATGITNLRWLLMFAGSAAVKQLSCCHQVAARHTVACQLRSPKQRGCRKRKRRPYAGTPAHRHHHKSAPQGHNGTAPPHQSLTPQASKPHTLTGTRRSWWQRSRRRRPAAPPPSARSQPGASQSAAPRHHTESGPPGCLLQPSPRSGRSQYW